MAAFNPEYKKMAYLTGALGMRSDSELLTLAVNLLRKDLSSPAAYEVELALMFLSSVMNKDLASTLFEDVLKLFGHSKTPIRRKAVVVVYKMVGSMPELFHDVFKRLKDKISDEDENIAGITVSALFDLLLEDVAGRWETILTASPLLFNLMKSSKNNLMLLKIVKIFAVLSPLEPRLAKKVLPALHELLQTTAAMSVMYECIHSIVEGKMLLSQESPDLEDICVEKLKAFIVSSDQNLKYVGLNLLQKLLKQKPSHSHKIRGIVLVCLNDGNLAVKLSASRLLCTIMDKSSAKESVQEITKNVILGKETVIEVQGVSEIVECIISNLSYNCYERVDDFEWLVETLLEFVKISGLSCGEVISNHFIELALRVPDLIPFMCEKLCLVITRRKRKSLYLNLNALAGGYLVIGEYFNPSSLSKYDMEMLFLFNPKSLPVTLHVSLLLCLSKLCWKYPDIVSEFVQSNLKAFLKQNKDHPEVFDCYSLLKYSSETALISSETLEQNRFSLPISRISGAESSELDLETQFNENWENLTANVVDNEKATIQNVKPLTSPVSEKSNEDEEAERQRRLQMRQQQIAQDPFYLKTAKVESVEANDVESIPIAKLDLHEVPADSPMMQRLQTLKGPSKKVYHVLKEDQMNPDETYDETIVVAPHAKTKRKKKKNKDKAKVDATPSTNA